MPTCGGLFDGAGLLAAGLHRAGWEHSWLCESDPWRRELLRTRFPDAVIYDDVRTVRGPLASDTYGDAVRAESVSVGRGSGSAITGRACEAATNASRSGRGSAERDIRAGQPDIARRVDLIAGGFPCKGASTAGKREGFEHAETVLWGEFRRLIGELGPRYVIIENVENILGMAARPGQPRGSLWGTVLAEMAALGFDVRWDVFPAASVGAPHLRERVFAVGVRRDGPRDRSECATGDGHGIDSATSDAAHIGSERAGGAWDGRAGSTNGRPHAADSRCDERRPDAPQRDLHGPDGSPAGRAEDPSVNRAGAQGRQALGRVTSSSGVSVEWGDYAPAIRRWERVHGEAPAPLVSRVLRVDDGDAELQRVRTRLDRSDMRTQRQRLSALGDGVHVYIAEIVGEYVMGLERQRLMSEVVALAETP